MDRKLKEKWSEMSENDSEKELICEGWFLPFLVSFSFLSLSISIKRRQMKRLERVLQVVMWYSFIPDSPFIEYMLCFIYLFTQIE